MPDFIVRSYKPFLRFLFLGGIATLVNLLVRFILSKFVAFEVAIVIAYLVGMFIAFILFKFFAFPQKKSSTRSKKSEVARFIAVNAWGVSQTLIVSVVLVEHVLPFLNIVVYQQEIAHILALSLLTVTSYLGHNYFTFN
ncbi:GtrA family protein [Halodesulfovibrio marinisediminis]|uniref:Putative flippase GtrA (Transmembrane translocase of bactoprenol-linked glucose) n=1 Tax=Halodesulfovibrio marinisediminis DSM 17456 TaxID=1121457 RepID=A0A1N6EBE4_9BACT|nr:GtrA family protein [Halodesulfovibrio marinisediminis]SIN80237.1 Putative flippase GtrA (transmembrane translocase of bactoprenol-linked glucose) [Halodesulfovibrio marinisediminis DSM 17456]